MKLREATQKTGLKHSAGLVAVAATSEQKDSRLNLAGKRVIPIEYDAEVPLMDRVVAPQPNEDLVAYDLWSRVIGITTFQDQILQAVLESASCYDSHVPLETAELLKVSQRILDATAAFLQGEGRVVEISTGMTLSECCFVRVDKQLRIKEVLADPAEKGLNAGGSLDPEAKPLNPKAV